jgi:L-iditol 2-dehydrogenase
MSIAGTDSMRAAVLHSPGDIRIEHVSRPAISGPGQVLLAVEACGVCGSDIGRMMVKGAHAMPLICGHEFSGRVVDASDDVVDLASGDLVTVPPLIPCNRCDRCREGQFSLCQDYDYFGSRRDGAYTETVVSPATNVVKVPDGVDPVAAAMTDPAAIALHALRKTRLSLGSRVAVVGAGPIGLFAIQFARLAGASVVAAIDISEAKLSSASTAGADGVFLDAKSCSEQYPAGFDIVFESAGVPVAENAAITLCAPQGEAVFVGIPLTDVSIDVGNFSHFLRQEITLHGSWNSFSAPWPGSEWTDTLQLFASGELRWEFMVTHDLPIEEVPRMLPIMHERSEHTSKVIFRPESS